MGCLFLFAPLGPVMGGGVVYGRGFGGGVGGGGQLSGMPVASFWILEGQEEGGPSTPEEQVVI